MSTPFFGTAPQTHNPFATRNSQKDIKPNFLNFIRPVNGFGTPSGPIPPAFGSKTSSTVWPDQVGTNSNNSQVSFPESLAQKQNTTSILFGSTPPQNSPFQPLTSNTSTSDSNRNSKNIPTSMEAFSPSSFKDGSKKLSPFSKPSNFKFPSTTPQELPSNPNLCSTIEDLPTSYAERIQKQLSKDGIFPPILTVLDSISEQSDFIKVASELKMEYSNYREKVRASLIKANLLDDPKVQKKLADAIDFKGTCEKMCPEYECLARIIEGRHDKTERDVKPDGSLATLPKLDKMVKALARSAAGQDAPLPCDIRTAAALRRTVDYLFKNILAERELESVHGFLWDRTRAIRRDFVFHSSVTPTELLDQIYCLERIIRFHAISLHYMSKDGISTEGFSDQQEREQLSRSLLSLIHAYDDCKKQGIECENENEFKAYYIVFNGEIPGILETVQNWGFELWENSEIIRNAVCLSESLQNTWDFHGPLNPASTMEVGQNAYSRFFSIVEDSSISYTMACFAEIYFNKIRKGILRTILSSYRKQRGQTKDWTAEKLNTYLRFDDQNEVEPFVELYGLHFAETDNEWCLSFDSTSCLKDPHPLPKQPHSYHLVERKRGTHSLVEAINCSVYEPNIPLNQSISHASPAIDLIHDENPMLKNELEPYSTFQSYYQIKSNPFAIENSEPCPKPVVNQIWSPPFNQNLPKSSVSESLFVDSNPGPSKKFDNFQTPNLQLFMKEVTDQTSTQQCFINKKRSFQESSNSDLSKISPKEKIIKTSPQFSFQSPGPTGFQNTDTINSSAESDKKAQSTSTIIKAFPNNSSSTSVLDLFHFSPDSNENNTKMSTGSNEKSFTSTVPSQIFSLKSTSSTSSPNLSLQQSPLPQNISNDNIIFHKKPYVNPPSGISDKSTINRKNAYLEHFTKWIFMGDEGLLEQFSDFQARKIVHDTFSKYQTELMKKLEEEADKDASIKADQFRRHSLSVKFGYFWREQARRIRLKRKGREARQLRIEMAKSLKLKEAALSSSLIEDFKASTIRGRRQRHSNSVELNDPKSGAGFQLKDKQLKHKRRRSEKSLSSNHSISMKHQNSPSNDSLNRSLLSDPSYLSGQSRIHLLHFPPGNDENSKSFNGVKSDYFRLKARGINNFVGKKPISSVNSEITHATSNNKNFKNYISHQPKIVEDLKTSLNESRMNKNFDTSMEYELDLSSLDTEASQQIVDNEKLYNGVYTDDDSILFHRAKKIREQMDEGAEWFRKETDKGGFHI